MIKLVLTSIAMLAFTACASSSDLYIPDGMSKSDFIRWAYND